ncbi:MAG: hypothetical protein LBL82_01150 [Oscillospiraceae bacterium]|jgi:hypothetical protein|nr:hypothetical protein [Oscillospiraceae bacterium]
MSTDKNIFEYEGITVIVDPTDYECLERSEKAKEIINNALEASKKIDSPVESTKLMFDEYSAALNLIVNDNSASEKVLGGTKSFRKICSVLTAYFEFFISIQNEISTEAKSLTDKYATNREQRRNAAKK